MKPELKAFLKDNDEWSGFTALLTNPPDADALRLIYPDVDAEVAGSARQLVSQFVTRGALYCLSRERGNDDRWAAMFAMQRPCRGETDATFLSGMSHFSEVYGEEYAAETKEALEANGVCVTPFTDYEPSLADRRGDPRAVLEGRGTIRRREEVLARCGDIDPLSGSPRLSKRLINETAIDFMRENPDEFAKMTNRDVEDHMTEKHAPAKVAARHSD